MKIRRNHSRRFIRLDPNIVIELKCQLYTCPLLYNAIYLYIVDINKGFEKLQNYLFVIERHILSISQIECQIDLIGFFYI